MFRYDTHRSFNAVPLMAGSSRPEEHILGMLGRTRIAAMASPSEAPGMPGSTSVAYLYAAESSTSSFGGEYSPESIAIHPNGTTARKVSGRARAASDIVRPTAPLLPLLEVDGSAISSDDRELNDLIAPYLRARGMDDLYERMLDRVERIHGRPAVQGVLSILWGARLGMEEPRIAAIGALKPEIVGRVLAALENHLTRIDSRITILREELRAAVERRYLGSGFRQQELRAAIAGHFAAGAIDPRRIDEEPWQWMHADRHDHLRRCVVNVPMTMALILQERSEDLFLYWHALEGSCNLVGEYERLLEGEDGRGIDEEAHAEIFHALSDFYAGSYRYDLAKSLLERSHGAGDKALSAPPLPASELDDILWRGAEFAPETLPSPRHARGVMQGSYR